METVTVAVPNEGKFTFEYNGQSFEVVCPDGNKPGDEITVQLPAPTADEQASTAKLETEDVLATIASHVTDAPTLAALSRADKTSHEATAPAMASVRWPIATYGSIVASERAKAALEAGFFSMADLKLDRNTWGERDEGDYDTNIEHSMKFQGQEIWSLDTCMWCGIGGCGGTSSSCEIKGDKLKVSKSKLWGRSSIDEEETYELKDILISAAVKAGAKPPLRPDTIYLRVRAYPASE